MFTSIVSSKHVPLILFLKYDYTDGQLDELLDVIIDSKAALFVSAIGVPPKAAVDRLHAAGIPVMKQVPFFGSELDINDSANIAWLDTQGCVSNMHHLVCMTHVLSSMSVKRSPKVWPLIYYSKSWG